MKKVVILSVIAILTSLPIYRVVETYVSRASDYPDYPNGPTVNGEDLHTNHLTSTIYTSANMEKGSLFTGVAVRFHPNGEPLVKSGIKNGKLHGPFDSWHENGQKHISLVWIRGEKVKNFKAYHPNGTRISGNQRELAEKVFGNAIIIE